MKNVLQFSKQLLEEHISKDGVVVDATVGNGNDTLFLCERFKYVYGFDIQSQAIQTTHKVLDEFQNYELILDSHANVDKYVSECNGAIFNLGYLPNHDHSITTNATSTIEAVEKLMTIVKQGIIVIVVYRGHDDAKEAVALEKFLSNVDKKYDVLKYEFINRSTSPYILAIKVK